MQTNNSQNQEDNLSRYYTGAFYDAYENGRILRFKGGVDDLAFWGECAKKYGPSILELGCGSGRVASFLSNLGYEITGIDLSESMLSVAREKSPSVNWLCGNMQDFKIDKKFDMIFVAYNTFLHNLNNQEAIQCLSSIKTALNKNGKLIFDILNPSYEFLHDILTHSERTVCSIFRDPSSKEVVIASREIFYEADPQIITMKIYYDFTESCRESFESLYFKLYFPQEINLILQTTGYEIDQKHGDLEWGEFLSSSKRQVIVCHSLDR